MPKNYVFFFLLIATQSALAQKRVLISGIVTVEGASKKPINVINYNTKLVVTPKPDGQFEIWARKDDLLIFMLDDYLDQQIMVSEHELKNKISILLKKKPVELDEVDITKNPLAAIKVTQGNLDEIKLQKQASTPVVQGVYTGEIVNGVDFIRMGKGLVNLFKKKDGDKKKTPPIVFKEYIAANYNDSFFIDKLQLQPDQVFAFIDYCNADPRANNVIQSNNTLTILEFLIAKSEVFKKL